MPHKDPEVRRAYYAAWYEEKRDHILEQHRTYYLKHRARIKARVSAYQKRLLSTPEGREASRKMFNTIARRRYAQNPTEGIAKVHRYHARKKGAPVNDLTAAQWQSIKDHYGHRCVYCGRQMQRLEQDHIIPLSKGGSHTVQNVVPACKSCNSKKRDKAPLIPVQPLLLTPR